MAIHRSQQNLAFKTTHQRKGASVRACVGESQEIEAFCIICPPISHNEKLISNFKRCSSKGVPFDSPGINVAIGF